MGTFLPAPGKLTQVIGSVSGLAALDEATGSRTGANIDNVPPQHAAPLHLPGYLMARKTNHQVPHGPEHEQQAKSIAYESRHADHCPANEHDESIQQLPGGKLTFLQATTRVSQYREADASYDKRPRGAHGD